jgi:hypothetical protein
MRALPYLDAALMPVDFNHRGWCAGGLHLSMARADRLERDKRRLA